MISPLLPGRPASFLLIASLALPGACGTTNESAGQPTPVTEHQTAADESVRPGINDRFLSDDLDVDEMVGIFEVESREVVAARDAIAAQLELAPGMSVADVGAGTGLYMPLLARGVGPRGTVYAVDISPTFVAHLEQRARDEHLPQVKPRLCDERSAGLSNASVDRAFVCDTYHHFEYPAATLASLFSAIRPGGLLVIVDFERIPGVSREWLLDHVRAGKEVFRAEIEAAGFEFIDEPEIEQLEENYLLRFRRP